MAGLLGLLDLGAGALAAQEAGVSVAGRNTANVGTEGYQRESVQLDALPGAPLVGGVMAGGVTRASDLVLASSERLADGAQGRADSLSSALSALEQQLDGGSDVVSSIGDLFAGLQKLAAAPTDPSLRADVLTEADTVASSFRTAAATVAQSQKDADSRLTTEAQSATQLAAQIAQANQALATHADPTIADARDLAARKLAAIVGGQARVDPDGKLRFVAAGGVVLVDGDRAATVSTAADASDPGRLHVLVTDGAHTDDVTSRLDGGQMAGESAFRDGAASDAAGALDQLAYDLSTQLNAVHSANAGLDGVSGRNLFSAPAQVSGAAAAIVIDPTTAADPGKVAAAAPGVGPGDSSGALALAALADHALAVGGTLTFSDGAIAIGTGLGTAAKAAAGDLSLAKAKSDVLASARDSVSGVSSDEELAKLAGFQHAAEAAQKFLSTVNDLLASLIQNL